MDYLEMAEQLLQVQSEQLRSPAWRGISKVVRGELLALFYLHNHGGAYPGQMSAALSVSSARIAAMLRHMEQKGWVVRSGDARDSRHTVVTMTGRGRTELQARREEILRVLAGVLERLGPEDTAALIRIQQRMTPLCYPQREPQR